MKKAKHTNKKKQTPPSSLRLLWGKDIHPKKIKWLWRNRIPLGTLTVIQGDPGLGKSLITLDMVAKVTTGTPFPFCDEMLSVPRGQAIILSAEDDAERILRPRLDAAGADPTRWAVVQSDGFFSIAKDVVWLMRKIEAMPDLRLIVIDPISAYYGDGIDDNRNAQIRYHLRPLIVSVAENDVSLTVVNHLNKQAGQSAMQRGLGSIALVAASRGNFNITKDKNKGGQNRLMMGVKNNYAKEAANDGMSFEVVEEPKHKQPVISWTGRVAGTADQALVAADDIESESKLAEAIAFVLGMTREGAVPSKRMDQERKRAKISYGTFKRACDLCPNVRYRQIKDEDGQYQGGIWWQEDPKEGGDETPVPASQPLSTRDETMGGNGCEGGFSKLGTTSDSSEGVSRVETLDALKLRLSESRATG